MHVYICFLYICIICICPSVEKDCNYGEIDVLCLNVQVFFNCSLLRKIIIEFSNEFKMIVKVCGANLLGAVACVTQSLNWQMSFN